MGAKFVAAIIGVIILVVLAQTFVFGGDDGGTPSVSNPGSIPTATIPADQGAPVLLGQGDAGGGGSGGSGGSTTQSTYTVQSGDTLGAIAAQMGVPPEQQADWVAEVLELNGMEDARQLQAGQELVLPGVPQAAATATPVPDEEGDDAETAPTAPPSATGTLPTSTPGSGEGSAGTYVVVEGDSAYLIALKHCVDDPEAWSDELLELNGVDAQSLAIGQELDLPPGTPAFCGEEGTGEEAPSEDAGDGSSGDESSEDTEDEGA